MAHFPIFTLEIQWRDLFTGHVVADLSLFHPRLHINLIQLRTEYADKVPLSKKGWQDAIESIYPFKINHFTVEEEPGFQIREMRFGRNQNARAASF